MLEVFNGYLNRETWHSGHDLDSEAFYRSLAKVVRQPSFNPDRMGDYMRKKKGVTDDDAFQAFDMAIRHRVTEAWAIKDYLKLGL